MSRSIATLIAGWLALGPAATSARSQEFTHPVVLRNPGALPATVRLVGSSARIERSIDAGGVDSVMVPQGRYGVAVRYRTAAAGHRYATGDSLRLDAAEPRVTDLMLPPPADSTTDPGITAHLDFEGTTLNDPGVLQALFRRCRSPTCADRVFARWEVALWERALITGSADDFRKYLTQFPSGRFVATAKASIEEGDWSTCRDATDVLPCNRYLERYPNGKWRQPARERLQEFAFAAVRAADDLGRYREFLRSNPDHDRAWHRVAELSYERARVSGDLSGWSVFRDSANVGSHVRQRWTPAERARYEGLMAEADREIERLLYEGLLSRPSLAVAREYLRRFPQGPHRQQVVVLMEPLVFAEARRVNSVEALQSYIRQYPEGPAADSARLLLDPILYAQAVRLNRPSAYRDYLQALPMGAHARDADSLVAWFSANPAVATINYPDSVIGSGRWDWTTVFHETGGRVGFSVSGSGYFQDTQGRRWGPNGFRSSRDMVTVKPGGRGSENQWVRGNFCGGRAVFDWTGTDDSGHPITFRETVRLVCRGSR